jgi:ADP-ribose pyrophosphatase
MPDLRAITIVEDRTASSRCDQGFLTIERLRLRNEYSDGSVSDDYDCDLVSRKGVDAVVAVLYEIDGDRREVRVLLREAIRAPIYLRHRKHFVHPDPALYGTLRELVAGIVEPDDRPGATGLCHRAAVEAREEAGLELTSEDFRVLGGETFASPGTGDEKLFFCAAATKLAAARPGEGDGSVMEEFGKVHCVELGEAISACRDGRIPDMKTEVGLLRLADQIGYIPQLGCFADELPGDLAARHRPLGLEAS